MQACKPDSVSRKCGTTIIYLGWSLLATSVCLPTPAFHFSTKPDEQPGMRDIFGISARKVYPDPALQQETVSSYLTFSPLSRICGIVIFCGTISPRC